MSLDQTQQIFETLKRSRNPLICIAKNAGTDGYASALGLKRVLNKLDREAVIVAPSGKAPANICFLDDTDCIRQDLQKLHHFVVELDAKKTPVEEVSYDVRDGVLRVYISPKHGTWQPSEVRTFTSAYRHDLIICLGAPDLAACGELFERHTDFFYKTPILNIDHSAENEHYGHLNVVDLTATSCGEVCHDLIERMDASLLDEETATAFLTGMIAKTRSFRTHNVTPKTLQNASRLLAQGARRETVVHHLFRTRTVHTLKLWGRALARLKTDVSIPIVWTLLSRQDFMHAGAEEEDLPDVIDELIASSPDAEIVALLFETIDHKICAIVRTQKPHDARRLTETFAHKQTLKKNPAGTREEVRLDFTDPSIVRVEQSLISGLTQRLRELQIH